GASRGLTSAGSPLRLPRGSMSAIRASNQPHPWGRKLNIIPAGRVDPGFLAIGAFLHGREKEITLLERGGKIPPETELIIPFVRQIAAGPDDFLHPLRHRRPVI